MQQLLKVKDAVCKNVVSQTVPRETERIGKQLYLPKLRHVADEILHGGANMGRIDYGVIILVNPKRLIVLQVT